jgi:general secretion pathway protein D
VLDVRPQVSADNYTIDMDLVPRVIEFEGFVNYGTPLTIVDGDNVILLSENFINQPVFSSREIKTSVKVFDGQTLVLGGLIREDTQVMNDKIPLLGDLPLFGRLFRSKVEQAVKKNLMIFVTPTLVTPTGELVNPPEPIVLSEKTARR